jgi:hypothetical protein
MEHENVGLRARLKKAEGEVQQLKRNKPQTSLNDAKAKVERLDKALGERTADLEKASQQLRLRETSLREVTEKYRALEGNYKKVVQGVVRKAQRFEERKYRPIPRQLGVSQAAMDRTLETALKETRRGDLIARPVAPVDVHSEQVEYMRIHNEAEGSRAAAKFALQKGAAASNITRQFAAQYDDDDDGQLDFMEPQPPAQANVGGMGGAPKSKRIRKQVKVSGGGVGAHGRMVGVMKGDTHQPWKATPMRDWEVHNSGSKTDRRGYIKVRSQTQSDMEGAVKQHRYDESLAPSFAIADDAEEDEIDVDAAFLEAGQRLRSGVDGEGSFETDVNRAVTPLPTPGWEVEAPTYVRAPDLPFPVLQTFKDDYSPRPAGHAPRKKKVPNVGASHNAVPPRLMLDAGTKAALERKILAAGTGVPNTEMS